MFSVLGPSGCNCKCVVNWATQQHSLYRTMLHKLSLEERISICGYKICVAMAMKVASFSAAMG